jgi:ubiquinone/menaquinone biosynthesis C-methylase UbiE
MNPGYSEVGFEILFAEAGRSFGSAASHQMEQMEWLQSKNLIVPNQAFLDVGCYEGHFLSLLPKSVRKFGVDIDHPAIYRGRSKYSSQGLTLIHGPLETFQLSAQPDVITMFHVLEHLYDPFKVLQNLHENSHDTTRLVIEVPILEKGATNDINGFFSIQHMTHFSLNSLEQLLHRSGWKIIDNKEMNDYNGYRILAKRSKERLEKSVSGNVFDKINLLNYLKGYFANLVQVSNRVESWSKTSRAIIWGGGAHTEFLYQVTHYFEKNKDTKFIIVDSDQTKHNATWRGLNIYGPAVLKGIDWSDCSLVISSYGSQQSIVTAVQDLDVPAFAIRTVYDYIKAY